MRARRLIRRPNKESGDEDRTRTTVPMTSPSGPGASSRHVTSAVRSSLVARLPLPGRPRLAGRVRPPPRRGRSSGYPGV